jgi:hypothetical protein
MVFVVAIEMDLHIGHARSLKDKRSVVRSILDSSRRRFGVSAAEVGHQQVWQRSALGFAVVASSESIAVKTVDQLEQYVMSHPEVEIVSCDRTWIG